MLLDKFIKAGQDFLECKFPIMCGAMTWVSDYKLIGALGNAGGFGLLAGGNAPVDILEKEIIATREYTDAPFGVNLITIAPVYKDQLQLVCDMHCELVMFAGSIPKDTEIQQVKDTGAKVICFAPTAPRAHRLIKMGMDKLEKKLIDQQQAQYEVENFWVGALRDAAINGNIERGSLMAGQSVGLVNKIKPIQGIIDEMVNDAESELKRLNKIFMET
jgi:NAD(P)H-dependent flavin oxidoreductase YrpB (nitropropane dioxygenase family)